MAELPIPEQLGQRSFQDRSQVVRPAIDFSGQQNFVNAAQQFSSNVNDRLDQSSLQKAKIQFQRAKLDADKAFDQDTDFATHEQRYNETLGKAAEESAKLVRNPRMQEQFKQEIGLYQAEGAANIQKRAFAKEIDHGVANLDEALTMSRENYLRATSTADKELARKTMVDSIDLAEQNSYIDADKAQALRQKTAVDLAIASIKVEPADKQVKLLKENQGLIDVIPKDVRMQMIKEAEGQSQTNVALSLANNITARGGDLSGRFAEADKISDVKVRELTKQQIEQDFGREKRAVAEKQYNAYDTLKKDVIAGSTSLEVSQQNPDLWNSMSGDQQQAIRSMDTKKGEQTDLNVYNKLNQLAATDKQAAYLYFTENAHKLSSSDVMKWSDRLAKPEELEGYLTQTQRLDTALNAIGVKDKKGEGYKMAQDQLDKDVISFEKTKGHKPDAEELDKLVNNLTDRVVDGSYNPFSDKPFGSDKYGFQLTPEQRKTRKVDVKLNNFETKLTKWENHLSDQQGGIPVVLTDDEKNRLYKAWDKAGLLDAEQ